MEKRSLLQSEDFSFVELVLVLCLKNHKSQP